MKLQFKVQQYQTEAVDAVVDDDFFISDWLRNRNTIEFLGVWERLNNPSFNYVEFDGIGNKAGLLNRSAIQQMRVLLADAGVAQLEGGTA